MIIVIAVIVDIEADLEAELNLAAVNSFTLVLISKNQLKLIFLSKFAHSPSQFFPSPKYPIIHRQIRCCPFVRQYANGLHFLFNPSQSSIAKWKSKEILKVLTHTLACLIVKKLNFIYCQSRTRNYPSKPAAKISNQLLGAVFPNVEIKIFFKKISSGGGDYIKGPNVH